MSTLNHELTKLLESTKTYLTNGSVLTSFLKENETRLDSAMFTLKEKLRLIISQKIVASKEVMHAWESKCLILESDEPEEEKFINTAINAIVTVATGKKER